MAGGRGAIIEQSEHSLQVSCVNLLRIYEHQGKLTFFAVPNGSSLSGDKLARIKQAARKKAEGLRSGVTDLVLVLPAGRVGWAELKTRTGTLDVAQKEWRDKLIGFGHVWKLVRELEDMHALVRELGVAA